MSNGPGSEIQLGVRNSSVGWNSSLRPPEPVRAKTINVRAMRPARPRKTFPRVLRFMW
jgi:hypothetical protein